jgi:DNA end-binding protein Ku
MVADPVQKRLLDIIAAKRAGAARAQKPVATLEPRQGKITIMDALRRSVATAKKPKRSTERMRHALQA